ncbi:MAG: hypothetical protein L6264_12065 [Weeksellaceae bacterium]|nr:hypothetical protein [Bacteroidota bacterium]MCG2781674.1 hypothetical protein [Weeksellaceae bacterium]
MRSYFLIILLFLFVQCDVLPSNTPVYRPKTSTAASAGESREFEELIAKDQINKKKVTAEVLTYLLNDTEADDPKTAAVIENSSGCNIIVRLVAIKGNTIYNLPVPKHGKNQFVIDKGSYTLRSNICGAVYYSQKLISDPLILELSDR